MAISIAAAGTITQPTGNPFVVPGDASGNPLPFTITASGFTHGQPVSVEQCDGTPATAQGWSPTVNCDLGSSPAPATADSNGVATFSASDPNHAFHPFKGMSPQGLFNCLSPHDPSPNNGLRDFRDCQVRVSTNNSALTADQAFLSIQLPDAVSATTTSTSTTTSTTLPLGKSPCGAKEIAAGGKKATAKATCYAKAVAKGKAVDSVCLSKAETQFSTAFGKAMAAGHCPTATPPSTIETQVNSFVSDLVMELSNAPSASKCSSKEIAAAAKKVSAKAKCYAKAVGKGGTVDPSCLSKAETTFSAAFGKAQGTRDCQTATGEGPIETKVDNFVATLKSTLAP